MKALDLLAPPPWQIFSLCVSACGEFFSLHSLSLSFSLHFCFIVSFVSARCSFSAPFLRCSNIFQPCHPFEESTTTCHPPRSWTRRVYYSSRSPDTIRCDTIDPDRARRLVVNYIIYPAMNVRKQRWETEEERKKRKKREERFSQVSRA